MELTVRCFSEGFHWLQCTIHHFTASDCSPTSSRIHVSVTLYIAKHGVGFISHLE